MKRILVVPIVALAAVAVIFLARPARAGTNTNTLTVTASVLGICTIDPAALAFGNYDSTANVDVSTNITVHCTQGSSYWIGLGLGSNATGSTRRMVNGGANFLTYELYRDNARTQIWDNADPAPTPPHSAAGNPGFAAYTTPVYGRIPAAQVVPIGGYADSVVMTVNF
jgi:spore coat protein U domain-containing protein, fimbrial subunit CupE1/2/3/6